jgi:hypothetical protein
MMLNDTGPMPVPAGELDTRPNRVITVSLQDRSGVILTRGSDLTPESAWADLVDWLRSKGHIE